MSKPQQGFTLVELAIVLVIIGLIVGGVLVGRDLIDMAAQRAQISQIEKYKGAVHTFQVKYGGLPGDLSASKATQFGFLSRTGAAGKGDGDGTITAGNSSGCCNVAYGELGVFWVDLSAAGLIPGTFNTASFTAPGADSTNVDSYLPPAKLGRGNYVYLWAGGSYNGTIWLFDYTNFFGISAVTAINGASDYGTPTSTPGITSLQARNIDDKIDDGLPEYGKVMAIYVNHQNTTWSDGTIGRTQTPWNSPDTQSITPSATTCYDNAGNGSAIKHYTVSINDGAGLNCGLSFKF